MTDEIKKPTLEELSAALEAAKRTIKEVNAESAERRVKLKKLEEEKAEKDKAALSDAEKLQAEIKAVKDQHETLTAELQAERVRTAILAKATELGFASPEDALSLTNLADVEVKDGKVSGFEKSLKALAESKRLAMKDDKRSDGLGTPTGRGKPASGADEQSAPVVNL